MGRMAAISFSSVVRKKMGGLSLKQTIWHVTMATAVVVWLCAIVGTVTAAPAKKAAASKVVSYAGTLHDHNGSPVGGIYPLTFSIFSEQADSKAKWSDSFWVSVDNGRYTVELGRNKKIPSSLSLANSYVGVSLSGGAELVRERLVVEDANADSSDPTSETPSARQPVHPSQSPHGNVPIRGGNVDYAEKAGFAYEAEHATNADKIANMDVEQLKSQLTKPIKLGTKTTVTGQAGGKGGYEFEELCPKGYVVTGMKGAAGIYLDSIQLVCSPLE
ncbi:MAG: hypothetical protein HUU55_15785 [Myxococcales bacterium]|nr:hypothetical protein [Myxococcales bacterium]